MLRSEILKREVDRNWRHIMIVKLIDDIRSEFHKQLETKTGWGRNEIKAAFERAVTNALAKNAQ